MPWAKVIYGDAMNDTSQSAIEVKLASALKDGREPTLSDLGGVQVLQQGMHEICKSPLLPEFIHLLLSAATLDQKDRESILELTVRLIVCVKSLDMDEVVNDILSCNFLSETWEKQFFHSLLEMSFNQGNDPLCRAFALDGAFRFVGSHIPRRHTLLAKLTEVDSSDNPIFLRHAAKIIGVAFSWWQSEGLVERLREIIGIEDADDEAAFELGMASLVEGLNASDVKIVRMKLEEAQEWFKSTLEKRENRPDAALFVAVIQSWLDFAQESTPGKLAEMVTVINQELFALHAWHHRQSAPSWLGARYSEQASWKLLVERLVSLSGSIEKPSWFNARFTIEQELIGIITASRAILVRNKGGGLELIAIPKIVSSLVVRPGLIHHLREWLQYTPEYPYANDVKTLLEKIESNKPSNDEDQKEIINDARSALFEMSGPSPSSLEHRLLEECGDTLKTVDDYNLHRPQSIFNAILLLTFRYLISRMDLSKKNAPHLSFLFKPEDGMPLPTEDKLQQDFFSFICGIINSGSTQIELCDIASGRTDITVTAGGYRFVIEVKRESSDASFDNLKKLFINQTTEYQNTGIRLGILLVLDLSDKKGGTAHVTEQVQAVVVQRPNESSKRGVVIVRIPGNKVRPSDLTTILKRKQ
ncbi:MAG: hypothetical protein HQM06_14330 [Magnetococcales bacterium]|nr:hypothetical protein [Magnetococcales bacterium]